MKSSTKKIVMWALILMGIGAVLSAAALIAGARFSDLNYDIDIIGNRHLRDRVFRNMYNLNALLSDNDWDEDINEILEAKEDLRAAREELNDEYDELKEAFDELRDDLNALPLSFTENYKGKTVRSIEIDLSAVRIDIEQGEQFSVSIRQKRQRRVYSSLKNEVLEIDEKGGFNWKRNRKNAEAYVIITLPADTRLEELEIALNAGALYARHPSLTVGDLTVEVNAGAVLIKDITSRGTDIDCNAGAVRIDGRLRGKTEVDCNAGKIDLTIDGAGEDYSWETQAALGSIRVNNSASSGLANRGSSGSRKANHLDLSAAVGSIDVLIK